MITLEIILGFLSIFLAFITCFFLTKWWTKLAKNHKEMLVPDENKFKKPLIPKTGGIAVMLSIILAVFLYISFKTFILHSESHLLETSTFVITILLAGLIGFIDDIFNWKRSLSGFKKILLTIPITIPLIVINAGHQSVSLPFLGQINFALFYPLVLVPLGIVGTTNGFNLLAGYNGLEANLGIFIFIGLGIVSLLSGQIWLFLVAMIIIFSLLAFLIFNKYPAKIFPGNVLTYVIGSSIGCFAILGNMEKAALILFIPFIIEGFLKLRSSFKAQTMGIPNKDNSLEPPYKKNYSLIHLALRLLKKIKKKAFEKDVILIIVLFEILFIVVALINTWLHFI